MNNVFKKNEVGNRYGKLLVISYHDNDKFGNCRWWCKCDCGVEKPITGASLRKKSGTFSCGCLHREKMLERRKGDAVFKIILRNIKSDCKNRNIPFDLSLEDIKNVTVLNCTYCNRQPYEIRCRYQRSTSKAEDDCMVLNGIDRIIPSMGYVKDNITPCCKYCNRAKSDLTIDDFKQLIKLIYKNYIK